MYLYINVCCLSPSVGLQWPKGSLPGPMGLLPPLTWSVQHTCWKQTAHSKRSFADNFVQNDLQRWGQDQQKPAREEEALGGPGALRTLIYEAHGTKRGAVTGACWPAGATACTRGSWVPISLSCPLTVLTSSTGQARAVARREGGMLFFLEPSEERRAERSMWRGDLWGAQRKACRKPAFNRYLTLSCCAARL